LGDTTYISGTRYIGNNIKIRFNLTINDDDLFCIIRINNTNPIKYNNGHQAIDILNRSIENYKRVLIGFSNVKIIGFILKKLLINRTVSSNLSKILFIDFEDGFYAEDSLFKDPNIYLFKINYDKKSMSNLYEIFNDDPATRSIETLSEKNLAPARFDETTACQGVDPELFYPSRGESTKEAKAVCKSCYAQEACLDYALINYERHGIWGGKSERERRSLRRQRTLALSIVPADK
jgi:WhiB family redox-sensing transcriptional regulator